MRVRQQRNAILALAVLKQALRYPFAKGELSHHVIWTPKADHLKKKRLHLQYRCGLEELYGVCCQWLARAKLYYHCIRWQLVFRLTTNLGPVLARYASEFAKRSLVSESPNLNQSLVL